MFAQPLIPTLDNPMHSINSLSKLRQGGVTGKGTDPSQGPTSLGSIKTPLVIFLLPKHDLFRMRNLLLQASQNHLYAINFMC